MSLKQALKLHLKWLNNEEGGVRANLQGADLQGTDLQDVNLQDANLQGTKLQYTNLEGANLLRTDLQYANLRSTNLQYANLQETNLPSANLQYVNLRGANLQYANLRGANLQYANLQGTDLQDVNLQDADLRYAIGLSLNSKENVLCKFKTGLSTEAGIIYIGCKQHTIKEWAKYLEDKSEDYLKACGSKKEHDRCLKAIRSLIKIYELNKAK